MPLRLKRLCLLAAIAAATAWAQSAPAIPANPAPRIPAAKGSGKASKTAKTGVPDPDLLDGSAFDKEKRPLEGMLSEIEMGEQEGPKGAKISPDSGPAGSKSAQQNQSDRTKIAAGGGNPASQDSEKAGGGGSPPPEGPASEAVGTQVSDLKVPEGAQSAGGAQSAAPRDLQIGDATLQIQTVAKTASDVVGTESSSSQQYEKKLPSGGSPASSNNRNQGVEKGRVVPKGL
ncbi:MAG: hypothetical protein HYX71_13480 [Opitutae bacterium]|nr:hypothetical protein [Opitutae bacterium]